MWDISNEITFLNNAVKMIGINNLMIKADDDYYVYAPKNCKNNIETPQGRNSLIGKYTENWCRELFAPIAKEYGLYAINNVRCDEIGLTYHTEADLAFCTTNETNQKPENIKLIFEIKMSLTNNYRYNSESNTFDYIGDIDSHKGTPSLLRSDSMLKAIGKSINIRVDSTSGKKIPIVIIGNSPITKNYCEKVDALCSSGVIQKFISVNPNISIERYPNFTETGFVTVDNLSQLREIIDPLLKNNMQYFSAMLDNTQLGHYIEIADKEAGELRKAEKFLSLISGEKNV